LHYTYVQPTSQERIRQASVRAPVRKSVISAPQKVERCRARDRESRESSGATLAALAAQKLLPSGSMRSPAAFRPSTTVSQRRPVPALVAFAAFLSYVCGGCLSDGDVIPQQELTRLAQLPPEQRGQSVQVVEAIGDRRSDAIDTTQQPPPAPPPNYAPGGPSPEGYVEGEAEPQVGVGVGVMIMPGPVFPSGRGPGFAGGAAPGPRGLSGPRAPVAGGRAAP